MYKHHPINKSLTLGTKPWIAVIIVIELMGFSAVATAQEDSIFLPVPTGWR
jgi:hypothetical protein